MWLVSDKKSAEKIRAQFFVEWIFINNYTVYEIMWKNAECIFAFPQQQWLRQRATVLRYTYIGCLVLIVLVFPLKF